MPLKIGDIAPDFELPAIEAGLQTKVRLSDYRGKKHVVLSFHPLDWTPTCGEQVPALDADREKFAALDAQIMDISVDSIYSHEAWQKFEIGEVQIPMLSDFYPHGQVTEAFGIMRHDPPLAGISERAVFIVDKTGKIVFARIYALDQTPKIEELLEAVRKIDS